MSENFYWLTGDRYACVEFRKHIISQIKEESDWSVKSISEVKDISEIWNTLSSGSLFGPDKLILSMEGPVPDVIKFNEIVSELKENRKIILIEDSPIKNSKLYKNYKNNIQDFPPTIKNGIPNKQNIGYAKNIIKNVSGWKGDNDTFDIIFKLCDFDYGKTLNEIYKLRTNKDEDSKISKEDIYANIPNSDIERYDEYIDNVKNGNAVRALVECEKISEYENLEKIYIPLCNSLLEHFLFLQKCLCAIESGNKEKKDIAEYISSKWSSNSKFSDPNRIERRLYFYENIISKTSINQCNRKIKAINDSIRNVFSKKTSHRMALINLTSKII